MYVPKSKEHEFKEYQEIAQDYRQIEKTDCGKLHVLALVLETKGKPPRQSFAGYEFAFADIFAVSDQMCEVWLRLDNGEAYPLKFKRQNNKVLLRR